ncbi:MAG: hypothetical protein R2705_02295 [Ilumatobacteraceae bacterium]
MKTYEVFLKKAGKDEFQHAGSLDAPDDAMALLYARLLLPSGRGRPDVARRTIRICSWPTDDPRRHPRPTAPSQRRVGHRRSSPSPTRGDVVNDPRPISVPVNGSTCSLADDEHLVGSRHAEWIGTAPFLKRTCRSVRSPRTNSPAIAAVRLPHRRSRPLRLLRAPEVPLVRPRRGELCAVGRSTGPALAVRRGRVVALGRPPDMSRLAGLAALARRVEARKRSIWALAFLIRRMLHGPEIARATIVDAVVRLLPIAQSVWDPVEGEADALASGLCSMSSRQLGAAWSGAINALLADCAVPPSEVAAAEPSGASGSSRLRRSDGFAAYLARLQEVISIEPTATW